MKNLSARKVLEQRQKAATASLETQRADKERREKEKERRENEKIEAQNKVLKQQLRRAGLQPEATPSNSPTSQHSRSTQPETTSLDGGRPAGDDGRSSMRDNHASPMHRAERHEHPTLPRTLTVRRSRTSSESQASQVNSSMNSQKRSERLEYLLYTPTQDHQFSPARRRQRRNPE